MKSQLTALLAIIASASLITACGSDTSRVQSPTSPAAAPAAPVTLPTADQLEQTEMNEMVTEQNQYRDLVGQTPLTQGLMCNLWSVAVGTPSIARANFNDFRASFNMHGVFDQDSLNTSAGLNIIPAGIRTQYLNWYILKCSGMLIVTSPGYYKFDLASDDGSILTIDSGLINNDGIHATITMSGTRLLQKGFHYFELDYMQGSGSRQLQLYSGGSPVPAAHFFH